MSGTAAAPRPPNAAPPAGWTAAAVVAAALLLLVIGDRLLRSPEPAPPPPASDDQGRLVEKMISAIRSHSLDTLAEAEVYLWAKGILGHLPDPYVARLEGDQYRRAREALTGTHYGIGITVTAGADTLRIARVEPGSPAERAGLRPDDRILAIDGTPATGWSAARGAVALRGERDSRLLLHVLRAGEAGGRPVRLERVKLRRNSLGPVALLRDSVGYVALRAFRDGTTERVRAAVDSLRALGLRALILDLRQNAGGLLREGVRLADLFLPEGAPIGRVQGRRPENSRDFRAEGPEAWPDLPVVLLVDEGTASSAELFAAALQDHDRAVIVGGRTYGKGVLQTTIPVERGVAIRLTTGRWLAPSGRSFDRLLRPRDSAAAEADSLYRSASGRPLPAGAGIVPDVLVDAEGRAAAVEEDTVVRQALTVVR